MHPLLAYTTFFFGLGGVGLHVASRQVDAQTRWQRWVKFGTYGVIVGSAITSIFQNNFYLLAILISAIGLWEILNNSSHLSRWLAQAIAVILYLAIAAGFITFAVESPQVFLLFIYFQVVIFDGFSQVTGQLIGQTKLLPNISPGKTVEGLMGGILFCAIAAVLARQWVSLSPEAALLAGLTTAAFSFSGDSLASYLKRQVAVKDYSHLLPGHGGCLDRFDSLMMTGLGYTLLSQLRHML